MTWDSAEHRYHSFEYPASLVVENPSTMGTNTVVVDVDADVVEDDRPDDEQTKARTDMNSALVDDDDDDVADDDNYALLVGCTY